MVGRTGDASPVSPAVVTPLLPHMNAGMKRAARGWLKYRMQKITKKPGR